VSVSAAPPQLGSRRRARTQTRMALNGRLKMHEQLPERKTKTSSLSVASDLTGPLLHRVGRRSLLMMREQEKELLAVQPAGEVRSVGNHALNGTVPLVSRRLCAALRQGIASPFVVRPLCTVCSSGMIADPVEVAVNHPDLWHILN